MSAATATADSLPQETAALDLKRSFDPSNLGEWCELLKDIVAMANSGGGRIIIGLNDDGTPSGICSLKSHSTDPAVFVDKVYSYTGVHFAGVSTHLETHDEIQVTVLVIGDATIPLVFSKAGNYQPPEGKQRNAFNPGTLYVRHGAKSEPATSDDMRDILERHLKCARESLLANLRQVVEAPIGSVVSLSSASASTSDLAARPVRLVQDPAAAPAAMLDPNVTHPHRQKELIAKINAHFIGPARVTSNDILAIRRIHKTETDRTLCYKPRYASCQYSDLFFQWIVTHIESNPSFLQDLRQRFHAVTTAHNAATRRGHRSRRSHQSNQPSFF